MPDQHIQDEEFIVGPGEYYWIGVKEDTLGQARTSGSMEYESPPSISIFIVIPGIRYPKGGLVSQKLA